MLAIDRISVNSLARAQNDPGDARVRTHIRRAGGAVLLEQRCGQAQTYDEEPQFLPDGKVQVVVDVNGYVVSVTLSLADWRELPAAELELPRAAITVKEE